MEGKPEKLSPITLRGYRNTCNNHLGDLRNIRDTELCQNQNLIVKRLKAIDEMPKKIASGEIKAKRNKARPITGGPRVANAFWSALYSCYEWAKGEFSDDIKGNPLAGIWRPELPTTSRARCLSWKELGAIWRATEIMLAAPALYLGRYLEAPVPANSIRDPGPGCHGSLRRAKAAFICTRYTMRSATAG
jgi:hypothetical protein